MNFDTPILTRPYSRSTGMVPMLADREFWPTVMMSRPQATTPDIIYNLVSSTGDRFVDNLSNPLIAVT